MGPTYPIFDLTLDLYYLYTIFGVNRIKIAASSVHTHENTHTHNTHTHTHTYTHIHTENLSSREFGGDLWLLWDFSLRSYSQNLI